jgi:hypothetical protein
MAECPEHERFHPLRQRERQVAGLVFAGAELEEGPAELAAVEAVPSRCRQAPQGTGDARQANELPRLERAPGTEL